VKIIAFYLPQFHRIPENDKWWGEGFTEWTYVKKAKSLFLGHNQPREPLNDNYYNLLDLNIQKWQVDIAKKYGIYGFCYYHYWFKGKRLLEKPLEQILQNGKSDFPFCLSWANQSWTRTWYDDNKTVLMFQEYGNKKDWKKHFDYLLPFFLDKRYIKLDNKPVFLIYNSIDIEQCNEMIDYWQQLAKDNDLIGVYFINTLTGLPLDNRSLNFDAQLEFEPGYTMNHAMPIIWRILRKIKAGTKRGINKIKFIENKVENTIDYDEIYTNILKRKPTTEKTYLSVFTDWDNSPRRKYKSIVYKGVSPEKFEKYLIEQIKRSKEIYQNDLLFINAWNEWGEGAYLEPDKKFGFKYLEAIKNALKKTI